LSLGLAQKTAKDTLGTAPATGGIAEMANPLPSGS